MKRLIVVVVSVLAILVAGCGGHSETDKKYVQDVRSQVVTRATDDQIIEAGHQICDMLEDRQYDYLIYSFGTKISPGQIGWVVAATTHAYCPGELSPFEQWVHSHE